MNSLFDTTHTLWLCVQVCSTECIRNIAYGWCTEDSKKENANKFVENDQTLFTNNTDSPWSGVYKQKHNWEGKKKLHYYCTHVIILCSEFRFEAYEGSGHKDKPRVPADLRTSAQPFTQLIDQPWEEVQVFLAQAKKHQNQTAVQLHQHMW